MRCCSICPRSCDPIQVSAITAGIIFVAGIITMFVVGILGATGDVPMAPIGARLMVGISTFFILSAISVCLKGGC